MVWEPRAALRPLGTVRGEEGLTIWEYIAFNEACRARYTVEDEETEEEAEARFLFEEAFARDAGAQSQFHDIEESYFSSYQDDSRWNWDETGGDGGECAWEDDEDDDNKPV